jgi:predicted PurR-regulated permease PerM
MDEDKPDRPEPAINLPKNGRNLPLKILAALGVILLLQYAQSVFIPIVLGVLIAYSLEPFVKGFRRLHIPRAIGAAVAITIFVSTIGVGAYTLTDQAMAIVSSVPQAAQRVRERLRARRHQPDSAIQKVQRAATEMDRAAQEAAKPAPGVPAAPAGVQQVEIVRPFRPSDYLWSGGVGLIGFTGQFAMILFLVYFLLVTSEVGKRKLVKIAGPQISQKKITIQILEAINGQIESFIRVQLLTSFIVAVATGAALWWFGVNQFVVWGLLAGLFNSIPYMGPVVVTGAIAMVTFLQFDDLITTATVAAVTLAITTLEGFLLTPMLMGRAARMNPLAIFVGLLFWSWIWGIWGTVLAVPMLMMLKAVCDHVEDLQPIGELLGE